MKWDPQHFNHSVRTYEQLILPLLGNSELIILPESAIPALENQISPLLGSLDHLARQHGSEIIIGTLYQNEQEELFNSSVLLGKKRGNMPCTATLATTNITLCRLANMCRLARCWIGCGKCLFYQLIFHKAVSFNHHSWRKTTDLIWRFAMKLFLVISYNKTKKSKIQIIY